MLWLETQKSKTEKTNKIDTLDIITKAHTYINNFE